VLLGEGGGGDTNSERNRCIGPVAVFLPKGPEQRRKDDLLIRSDLLLRVGNGSQPLRERVLLRLPSRGVNVEGLQYRQNGRAPSRFPKSPSALPSGVAVDVKSCLISRRLPVNSRLIDRKAAIAPDTCGAAMLVPLSSV